MEIRRKFVEGVEKLRLHVPKTFRYDIYGFVFFIIYIAAGISDLFGSTPALSVVWFLFAFLWWRSAANSFYQHTAELLIQDLQTHNIELAKDILRAGGDRIQIENKYRKWWKEESKTQKEKEKYNELEEDDDERPRPSIGGPVGQN